MNRNFKHSILALCVAGALAAQMTQAQPKAKTTPTYFTLDNTAGVSSDNQGAYIQGSHGVGAMISSAGDFLATFYKGSSRSLTINYSAPVDPSNAPFSGIQVVNFASTSAWDAITVRDILSIPVGTTALRNGYILVQKTYTDPNGVPHVATQNWNPWDVNGLQYSVTRTASGQWIVESQNVVNGDETPLKFSHDTGTSWVFESAAYYHIPIRMTINQ
jgi:hypothetical protein